jgi:hypothetical protein
MNELLLKVGPREQACARVRGLRDPIDEQPQAPLKTRQWRSLGHDDDAAMPATFPEEGRMEAAEVQLILRDEHPALSRRMEQLRSVIIASRRRFCNGQHVDT